MTLDPTSMFTALFGPDLSIDSFEGVAPPSTSGSGAKCPKRTARVAGSLQVAFTATLTEFCVMPPLAAHPSSSS
jgi:hypothetical protein